MKYCREINENIKKQKLSTGKAKGEFTICLCRYSIYFQIKIIKTCCKSEVLAAERMIKQDWELLYLFRELSWLLLVLIRACFSASLIFPSIPLLSAMF